MAEAKGGRTTVSVRIFKEAAREATKGAAVEGMSRPEFISLAIMEKVERVMAEEMARRAAAHKPPPPQQPPPPRGRGKGGSP
jgi:hypothetical protein